MIKLIELLKKDPDHNFHVELNGPIIWKHYNTSYETTHKIHRWSIYFNWRPLAFFIGARFNISRHGMELHIDLWASLFVVILFLKKKDMDKSDEL